jgi:hypothetical protein
MGLKYLCPGDPKNFGTGRQMSRGFSNSQKDYISDNGYEYFGFPMVGENIDSSRTAINQPLTGRKRRGAADV